MDRPDISSGEALAGILRPGNAGSNTAADHVTVLDLALAALPAAARPDAGAEVLVRADSAGATRAFLAACRDRQVSFSVGFPIDQAVRDAIGLLPEEAWSPAVDPNPAPGVDFTYDGAGRLTSAALDGETAAYSYATNPACTADQLTSTNNGTKTTTKYNYDAHGNQLTDGTTTYTFDS